MTHWQFIQNALGLYHLRSLGGAGWPILSTPLPHLNFCRLLSPYFILTTRARHARAINTLAFSIRPLGISNGPKFYTKKWRPMITLAISEIHRFVFDKMCLCPAASGTVMARMWAKATSRTSIMAMLIRGTMGMSLSNNLLGSWKWWKMKVVKLGNVKQPRFLEIW